MLNIEPFELTASKGKVKANCFPFEVIRNSSLWSGLTENETVRLSNLNYSNMYLEDGSRLFKKVRKSLLKADVAPDVDKNKIIDAILKDMADMYHTNGQNFEVKELSYDEIGNKIYEDRETCFANTGCNYRCKKLLLSNDLIGAIGAIYEENGTKAAFRAFFIRYFEFFVMFNTYIVGLMPPLKAFVCDILEKITGEKYMYEKLSSQYTNKIGDVLQIYFNGTATLFVPSKEIDIDTYDVIEEITKALDRATIVCPECGSSLKLRDLEHFIQDSHTYRYDCGCNPFNTCDICSNRTDNREINIDNRYYRVCEDCLDDYQYCDICEMYHHIGEICNMERCECCGGISDQWQQVNINRYALSYSRRNRQYYAIQADVVVCDHCIENLYVVECASCGELVYLDDFTYNEYKQDNRNVHCFMCIDRNEAETNLLAYRILNTHFDISDNLISPYFIRENIQAHIDRFSTLSKINQVIINALSRFRILG